MPRRRSTDDVTVSVVSMAIHQRAAAGLTRTTPIPGATSELAPSAGRGRRSSAPLPYAFAATATVSKRWTSNASGRASSSGVPAERRSTSVVASWLSTAYGPLVGPGRAGRSPLATAAGTTAKAGAESRAGRSATGSVSWTTTVAGSGALIPEREPPPASA